MKPARKQKAKAVFDAGANGVPYYEKPVCWPTDQLVDYFISERNLLADSLHRCLTLQSDLADGLACHTRMLFRAARVLELRGALTAAMLRAKIKEDTNNLDFSKKGKNGKETSSDTET